MTRLGPSRYGARTPSAARPLPGACSATHGRFRGARALDVVGGDFIAFAAFFTTALLAAHRQNRHRRPPALAPFVLRGARRERTVELEAGAQSLQIGGERVDVVVDDLVREFRSCPPTPANSAPKKMSSLPLTSASFTSPRGTG